MGNTPVTIGVSTDRSSYESGSTITGRVYLSVKATEGVAARSLNLQIEGEETTKVTKQGKNDEDMVYTSSSPIIQLDTPLRTFPNCHIGPGQYEFPFVSTLPGNLPRSMIKRSGSCGCEIHYKIGAHIVEPSGKRSGLFGSWAIGSGHKSKPKTLVILGAPRSVGAAEEGIALPPETERVKFCCCFNRGTMTIQAKVARAILSPGEKLDVSFRCKNASTSSASGVQVALREIITWRAHEHRRTSTRSLGQQFVPVESLPELQPLLRLPEKYFGTPSAANYSLESNNINNSSSVSQDYEPLAASLLGSQKRRVSFYLSRDAHDSHNGNLIHIEHVLTVTIKTKCCINSPESSIHVNIQRPPPLSASATTVTATATPVLPTAPPYLPEEENDIPEAEVTLLPNDWSAETADLVTIQMAEPLIIDNTGGRSTAEQSFGLGPYDRATAPPVAVAQPTPLEVSVPKTKA